MIAYCNAVTQAQRREYKRLAGKQVKIFFEFIIKYIYLYVFIHKVI